MLLKGLILASNVLSALILTQENCPGCTKFMKSCNPTYSYDNSLYDGFRLVQLLAVFRHGDRMPLASCKNSNDQGLCEKNLNSSECVDCTLDFCSYTNCTSGQLSAKGFSQTINLGKHLTNYKKLFKEKPNVVGYHSKVPRTLGSLQGVLKGLGIKHSGIHLEESIANTKNHNIIKHQLMDQIKISSDPKDYFIYDKVITSLCSGASIECESIGCETNSILNFLEEKEGLFLENIKNVKNSFAANGVSIGTFGQFIESLIKRRNEINIISGHDSTIIKLLTALNVAVDAIPPYASVVLIEVLKDKHKSEFVRVIFEDQVLKIGLYKEKTVEFDKFITYLVMFNKTNKNVIDKLDNIKSKEEILPLSLHVKNLYRPIVNKLKSMKIYKNTQHLLENFLGHF